jgi:acetoin utilization deacetylase AcuC-like enzyme
MKQTGVFYSEVMRNERAPSDMNIGKGFDAIVRDGIFEAEGARLFEAKPVAEDLVLRVHSSQWVEQVKREGYWEVSLYSAGAVVMAFEKILSGELRNALSLVGIGGHHAGRDYAYGGCYVNHEAIAVAWARMNGRGTRFAIIDTDTHHGDGTRELFSGDDDVLHICYCGYGRGDANTKVCLPHASGDDEFVHRFRNEVPPLIREFQPELILWFCGLDTHKDSYGTRKLTANCYSRLCEVLRETAEDTCQGRFVVRVGCNAPSRVAADALPKIVKVLAGKQWR